jgi:hypothetical protein
MPAVLALGLDPVFVDPKSMGGLSPALRKRTFDCVLKQHASGFARSGAAVGLTESSG